MKDPISAPMAAAPIATRSSSRPSRLCIRCRSKIALICASESAARIAVGLTDAGTADPAAARAALRDAVGVDQCDRRAAMRTGAVGGEVDGRSALRARDLAHGAAASRVRPRGRADEVLLAQELVKRDELSRVVRAPPVGEPGRSLQIVCRRQHGLAARQRRLAAMGLFGAPADR